MSVDAIYMPVLTLRGVSVRYHDVPAVCDVSFEVYAGDFFCIVGENGSGKSSLVRAILGIVPVSNGTVLFGVPRERVAYVPQRNAILRDFPASVSEIVLTGRQNAKKFSPFYTAQDRACADDAMRELEIADMRERKIGELSGGQLQRVLLARALCAAPSLLILDEPEAGLDEESAARLIDLLGRLNRARRLSVVMVTHDMAHVGTCANRVASLTKGHVRFCGTMCEWETLRREGGARA